MKLMTHFKKKKGDKNYIVRIYLYKNLMLSFVSKSWPGMVNTKVQHKKYRNLKAEALKRES